MPLPPGPTAPPLVQFAKWLRDPLRYLDGVYAEYGGMFTMRLPGVGPMVIVSHPDTIKALFVQPEIDAPGDEELKVLLGENSVLLLTGPPHKQRRRLLMPPFNGSRMTVWGQAILDMTESIVEHWRPGTRINVRDEMQEITLNVMLQIVFGDHGSDRRQQLRRDVGDRMLYGSKLSAVLPLWMPFLRPFAKGWQDSMAAEKACDDAFYAEIRECRARSDPEEASVLAMLCRATDETGRALEDHEIRDELMTLMVAGHENTASALSWLIYWLGTYPEMRERIEAELDGLGPDPDPLAVAKLPYLEAVCNETLRYYPPVMLTMRRLIREPVEIEGVRLEPGTKIWGSIYLAHRRPEIYPDPAKFDPDRFLGWKPSLFEFIPFGGGHRRCIGMAFAIYEMKLIIAAILRTSRLSLVDGQDVKPKRRTGLLAPDIRFEVNVDAVGRPATPPPQRIAAE